FLPSSLKARMWEVVLQGLPANLRGPRHSGSSCRGGCSPGLAEQIPPS
uniref:Uncharacterized protein n=1 Tax=Gopherus agassizii TaxID=38772 RepID=A0A452I241_9SAUR